MAVSELCALFNVRQSSMSHHLKILASSGLVTTRREGNSIFYRRTSVQGAFGLTELHRSMLAAVDALHLSDEQESRLAEIHAARTALSQQFFSDNADKFREQQDLIASYEQYSDTVAQTRLDVMPEGRLAIEVGPGDGRFLSTLSIDFSRVIAVDSSATMLEQSRKRSAAAGLGNLEFIHGDTSHPSLHQSAADCVVANMVLHHTPSPADIFRDLSAMLRNGGVFILADLCLHDQGWARESCGDLWLGFEPEDLAAWAAEAGMHERSATYLTQRNGFRVQVKVFQKTNSK
jgi:ArsR family transcriptional regulator